MAGLRVSGVVGVAFKWAPSTHQSCRPNAGLCFVLGVALGDKHKLLLSPSSSSLLLLLLSLPSFSLSPKREEIEEWAGF